MNERNIVLGVLVAAGIAVNGIFIGRALERFRKEDRYISVKGVSEREVKANLAVWTITTRVTSNDLQQGSADMEATKNKILAFLTKNGIKSAEVTQKTLNVTDKMARDWGNSDIGAFRYIIQNTMLVRSPNVENLQKVSRMTDELLKNGIVLGEQSEWDPAVKYYFTGLNDIKPDMLAEATRNAKKAAQEFTKESGEKLGNLRKANQGIFSIDDRDVSLSGQGEGGYSSGVNDIYKKIKVVVSVDYAIN